MSTLRAFLSRTVVPTFLTLFILAQACNGSEADVRRYRAPKPTVTAAHAQLPQAKAAPQNSRATTPKASRGRYTWTLPAGWKAVPATGMRMASFNVATEHGAGDCSLIELSGAAGGVGPNVNRWRGQIGLGTLSEADIEASAIHGKGPLGEFHAFKLENPGHASGMLAAIFGVGGRTLFVKLTAPTASIDALEAPFISFCKSLREVDSK